jgi:glutaredoxin/cytochrome c biogenesis protein CcdA
MLVLSVLGLCLGGLASAAPAPSTVEEPADIEVFVRQGCPHCAAAKTFLAALERERPSIRIRLRDLDRDPGARARLQALAAQLKTPTVGVPAFHVRGTLLIGFETAETTGQRIRAVLDATQAGRSRPDDACPVEATPSCRPTLTIPETPDEGIDVPFLGRVTVQQLGFPLFSFVVGLLDGFNPCSMWVLVLMVAVLASLQDRFKMLLIAGTFIAVEGIAYFAFMAAWLNAFLLIGLSRISEVLLGTLATTAGVINIKDFWAFQHGPSLGIPESAKPTLYARLRGIAQAKHLGAALVGAVVLAVLVQVVEFLCTAGLPMLYTRILTMQPLEWWGYYGNVTIYIVAYMLDDIIVLTIGVVTLSQRRLQEREGRWLKLISGVVMLGLGILLLAMPEWLAW